VPVTGGTFSLMIGAEGLLWDDPAPLTASLKLALAGTSRFVEITVMSDAGQAEKPAGEWQVLAPRQALGSVPYALNGVPPGTVVPFAGTVIPAGWLLCDGTQYATDDRRFAALFAAIQTSFGSGTGTFRVPDLRGRVAVGTGQGSGTSNRLLAQVFGAETHTLTAAEMPSHNHFINLTTSTSGAHSHTYSIGPGDGGSRDKAADGDGYTREAGTSVAGAHNHSVSGNSANTGGDQPHNNMQPSIVLNYIIKF
jgi:microcystin-dependent protein